MRGCCTVMLAAFAADDPHGPPRSARELRSLLETPNDPAQTWYVPGERAGSAQAAYHMRLPDRENRHRAFLYLDVHPAHRRRGIGRTLLWHAARQAAEEGRKVLRGEVWKGSAGDAFARRAGAEPALPDARRVLVVGKLPEGRVAELRESAARAAAGYSLVTWTGRTPREHLSGFAAVNNAMNDRPGDADREDRIWDADRIRERVDGPNELSGNRHYTVAALHAASGELVAVTRIAVDPEFPEWGQQRLTAVTRPHRGHRLGLLVKAAMLCWLAEEEKALRWIVTENAAANRHMIAINETLGYELLDPQPVTYQLELAPSVAVSSGRRPVRLA